MHIEQDQFTVHNQWRGNFLGWGGGLNWHLSVSFMIERNLGYPKSNFLISFRPLIFHFLTISPIKTRRKYKKKQLLCSGWRFGAPSTQTQRWGTGRAAPPSTTDPSRLTRIWQITAYVRLLLVNIATGQLRTCGSTQQVLLLSRPRFL